MIQGQTDDSYEFPSKFKCFLESIIKKEVERYIANSASKSLKEIREELNKEKVIDDIIDRINKKQLK